MQGAAGTSVRHNQRHKFSIVEQISFFFFPCSVLIVPEYCSGFLQSNERKPE
jgi:hypothetical protein